MKTTAVLAFFSLALSCASAAHADTFGSGANTFDIDFVTIGNRGNVADTTGDPNPAGSVPYSYRMGKYEVSRDMIIKANAEGSLGIALTDMTSYGGNGADKPATGVTWFEAAQFVNWLNTSSGSTPAYKFNAGSFELWQSGDTGYNPNNLYRNSLARYFLPGVHEWYKAAYYDPTAGVYYDYPTGRDTVPDGIDFAGDTTFDAVFHDGYNQGGPNDITNVGVLSPYGTAGQGGNVWEWEETNYDLVNDSTSSARGFRGGFWDYSSGYLSSSYRFDDDPSEENVATGGFRVASVPEPGTLLLFCFGALGVAALRRWPRQR